MKLSSTFVALLHDDYEKDKKEKKYIIVSFSSHELSTM
jgi:hypothetical protein